MKSPVYLADDFRSALQALLPRGRAWPRDQDAIQTQALAGLSRIYEKTSSDAIRLLADAFPGTAYALLPEWESALGLPDPNVGLLPTIAQRRGQVLARFAGVGGQSIAYMINFAANLGYTISITQFAPARVGHARVGQPLRGTPWAHAWQVNAPLNTVTKSRVGSSVVGEPLVVWGNAQMLFELNEIAPAHTVLNFSLT
jgi:uncharacterized protein YmfQ (DUF2313 family)